MKILIVEDDFDKRDRITDFLLESLGNDTVINQASSLRSGLKEIVLGNGFDILLLDMSLPSFDITPEEPGGGTPESFAGKELMAQMKLRSISIPVIIITQYTSFEHGRITLNELRQEFSSSFSEFFIGAVYYSSAIESWKGELIRLLETLKKR